MSNMEFVAVLQQVNRDLLAFEMAKSGFSRQLKAIRSIPLVDPNNGSPVSKTEFKELGAAGMIIDQVSVEALIGLAANAIETFTIRLLRHQNTTWEPFKHPRDDLAFSIRPRQFRALNNVFKHQEGYIDSSTSRSAKFLVENGFFKNETYLKHMSAESIIPELELAAFEAFAHLHLITLSIAGIKSPIEGTQGIELVQRLREQAIYPVIAPALLKS
jgi:hypothetical protein